MDKGEGEAEAGLGDVPAPPAPTLPYLLCPSLFHPLDTWTTGLAWPRPDWTRLAWPGPDWPALLLFCARSLQNPAGPAPSAGPHQPECMRPEPDSSIRKTAALLPPKDQGTQRLTAQTLHAPWTPEACPHPRPPTRLSMATQSSPRAFSQNLKTT